jgi:hypothetical protein
VLDDHVHGRAVVEERALVSSHRLVGLDLPQDRRQPRHTPIAGQRVGQWSEVGHLVGEQSHWVAGAASALGVHVADLAPADLAATVGQLPLAHDDVDPVGTHPHHLAAGIGRPQAGE